MSRESHRNGDCGPRCQICAAEDSRDWDDYWFGQRADDADYAAESKAERLQEQRQGDAEERADSFWHYPEHWVDSP